MNISVATTTDARAMANLHASRITEGFLPTLGVPFLTRLYRRVVLSPVAFAYTAREGDEVVGFVAVASDLGALYRSFLLRDGVRAALPSLPAVVRSWRKAIETLRYPSRTSGAALGTTVLPEAEVLAVAVAPAVAGQGVGASLVRAACAELHRRNVPGVKVVCGAGNAAALALYATCGFAVATQVEVHGGVVSTVLVRLAPAPGGAVVSNG
ncbi:MAG: acetyltransferase family protein [Actinomycetia bacterium]|nr:acetyltransferase family protein [Actinomycetes bacterium]